MKRRKLHHKVEASAWYDAKSRCHDPRNHDYSDYGGRGIQMCEEWRHPTEGFWRFLEHIGSKPEPDLSLDRIDNDKGYEPGNVRWATKSQQNQNRRPNPDFKGETHPAAKLSDADVRAIRADTRKVRVIAEEYGIDPGHVSRIRRRLVRADA